MGGEGGAVGGREGYVGMDGICEQAVGEEVSGLGRGCGGGIEYPEMRRAMMLGSDMMMMKGE